MFLKSINAQTEYLEDMQIQNSRVTFHPYGFCPFVQQFGKSIIAKGVYSLFVALGFDILW